MTPSEPASQVAVLLYDDSLPLYDILASAVRTLTDRGVAVGGLLQRSGPRQSNGKPILWAEDIQTGETIRLDEPRGPGATACVLDTDALARASTRIRRALDTGARLILINRFGGVEAEGGGLRAEIADAVCSGAAVLIPIRQTRLPDLEAFLGCNAFVLQPSSEAIAAWAENVTIPA